MGGAAHEREQTGGVDTDRADAPDVSAWPGVMVTGVLTGGARARVYAAHRGEEPLVVKVSPRDEPSLDWELELLIALTEAGVSVPTPTPTADGRLRAGRVFVSRFLPGGPPRTTEHWRAAAAVVATVHEVTRGWPQRPGAASAAALMGTTRGADVDLAAMPPSAAALVRACWQPVLDRADATGQDDGSCVVHGDLGAGALLVDGDEVGIIDWDEARVDLPTFDLAALVAAANGAVTVPDGLDQQVLADAALAWEVATCWVPEPDYARRCLHQLRDRRTSGEESARRGD